MRMRIWLRMLVRNAVSLDWLLALAACLFLATAGGGIAAYGAEAAAGEDDEEIPGELPAEKGGAAAKKQTGKKAAAGDQAGEDEEGDEAEPAAGEPGEGGEEAVEEEEDTEEEEGEKQESEKPSKAWGLDRLRKYYAFHFQRGGRDPLIFRRHKEPKRPIGPIIKTNGTRLTPPPNGGNDGPRKVKDIIVLVYLERQDQRAEFFMLSHVFEEVIKLGDAVREQMKAWGNPLSNPEVKDLWRRINAYQETAKRLKQAEETRLEFSHLQIVIKAIRWTPQGGASIINAKIYEPGGILEKVSGKSPVQVEDIQEDAVVFLYKGLRFRKLVQSSAK